MLDERRGLHDLLGVDRRRGITRDRRVEPSHELAQTGEIDAKIVQQAIKDFGINPDKKDPAKS